MKLKDAMKIVDQGWIRKPKGFRVRFQKKTQDEVTTEYAPGIEEKPMDSDVVAWRLAWKLAEAQKGDGGGTDDERLFNILVVDHLDTPVTHYGTGKPEVLVREK